MFVLDSSGSILEDDFENIKDYVRNFAGSFEFGSDAAQFGVVSFSYSANVDIPLGTSSADFFSTLDGLTLQGGITSTADGINLAVDQFAANGRDNVPMVMLVITDGNSTDKASTMSAAAIARGMGITVFAIGIGSVDESELKEIASDPDESHAFLIDDFTSDSFKTVLLPLVQEICSRELLLSTCSLYELQKIDDVYAANHSYSYL